MIRERGVIKMAVRGSCGAGLGLRDNAPCFIISPRAHLLPVPPRILALLGGSATHALMETGFIFFCLGSLIFPWERLDVHLW